MSTLIALPKIKQSLVPSRGRIIFACVASTIGTVSYFILPNLPWRENIPAITVLAAAGAYMGILIADNVNGMIVDWLKRGTATLDDSDFSDRMRMLARLFPRRSVVFHWSIFLCASSYIVAIYVGFPILGATVTSGGLGVAAGLDPLAVAWAWKTGAIVGISIILMGLILALYFFAHSRRLLRYMYRCIDQPDCLSENERGMPVVESEIGRFIPRSIMHA